MTSRRPSHIKSRQEMQSTAAFFEPSTASSGATAASGEAMGVWGLNPTCLQGFVKKTREIFWEGIGYPIILLQPTWNRYSLTRSKQVSSKSSTNTTDSDRAILKLLPSFVSVFSSVFGRKALKIKRVWDFTKVYRPKCRRQCVDFCMKNALRLTCMHL
jgi:hypothetical protein